MGFSVVNVRPGGDHAGRRTVADVLMAEAERQVAANGHAKAWIAVVEGNARARAFYVRAGWIDEGPFVYLAAADSGPIEVPCHRYTKLMWKSGQTPTS